MKEEVKEFTYDYNPVKELKDAADAVVWTTKSLNMAVDAINKGLPLKTNPFCGKNTKLLKPDLVYKRTQEEIDDYVKCMKDPLYFASKCFLMTPEGLQSVKMRDYQEVYLNHLKEHRFSMLLSCRQAGKSVTTAIFCLWKILFNIDKSGLILSKSGPAGVDLLKKIKDMFLYLPYHLKCGVVQWNQHSISFDNNSSISTEAFSPTAGLGKTINFLILDEFAWCPANEVELFYNNIIPTITTISDSNVCIMSTQNGFNLFYKLYKAAIEHKSMYAPMKIDWWQVPQWNTEKKCWEKRTEEWHQMMVGILGSEEAFQYQYGTEFSSSDYCLVTRGCISRLREHADLFTNNGGLEYETLHKDCLYIRPGYDVGRFKVGFYAILCDLAEGGGGDSTVFNIFEMLIDDITGKVTFDQCGYWKSNIIDLENAALEFWMTIPQIFDMTHIIVSLEWNTYGALFYNYITSLNDDDYRTEDAGWRFQWVSEFDVTVIARYRKGDNTEDIAGITQFKNSKTIPGIYMSPASKKTACALLKMGLERGEYIYNDIVQIGELENFEDRTGSGSYKATYGHDDMMMSSAQIPMLQQTQRYKEFIEDMKEFLMYVRYMMEKNLPMPQNAYVMASATVGPTSNVFPTRP